MPINYNNLRLEIGKSSDAIYRKVKPLVQKEFDDRKAVMLEAFEEHPVTQELEAGPESSNSSFVDTSHGGNLYSLLGFNEGEDPVGAIRETLEKDIRLNPSQISREVHQNSITFKTPVRTPTLDTFNQSVGDKVPLAWTSRSFTDLIERGITGFPNYIFDSLRKFNNSRSGPAIQVKNKMRNGSMAGIRYVSQILSNFRKSITSGG